jgi:DNA-binding NarL/FixJ family response regulator
MHVVACGQIDDALVAVVGCEEIDDATLRTIAGIQRDGCPHVVVVVTRLDEEGVLAAGEVGTLGMLRRSEATPERLASVVAHVAVGETSVPADLVGRLLGAVRRLRRSTPFDVVPATPALDDRERSILTLLAEGRDTAEIASTLCYSERTVKGVIHGLTTRLQLRNRSHAVAFALRNELI